MGKSADAPAGWDGVLVIDKPAGPTSHDVVAMARRALGMRAIGHTGTLDPAATGVLALVLGRATRLAPYLGGDKAYDATIRFGRTTDTYDTTGRVVAESPDRPSRAQTETALAAFRGDFQQAPPPYSAKKVGGVAAHELARRDRPVQPPPAAVTVHALDLAAFDGDSARLTMVVSSGFYVRSLAHDLGRALGMGAALEVLRRTRAGPFTLASAVDVGRLMSGGRAALEARLQPLDGLLPDLPTIALTDAEAALVRHGHDVERGTLPLARLVDGDGRLVALARPGKRAGFLHPAVVLG